MVLNKLLRMKMNCLYVRLKLIDHSQQMWNLNFYRFYNNMLCGTSHEKPETVTVLRFWEIFQLRRKKPHSLSKGSLPRAIHAIWYRESIILKKFSLKIYAERARIETPCDFKPMYYRMMMWHPSKRHGCEWRHTKGVSIVRA